MIGKILSTAKYEQAEIDRINSLDVDAEIKKTLIKRVFDEGSTFKVLQRCAAITAGGSAITMYFVIAMFYLKATFIENNDRMHLVTDKLGELASGVSPVGYMGVAAFALYLGGGALEGAFKKLGYKKV